MRLLARPGPRLPDPVRAGDVLAEAESVVVTAGGRRLLDGVSLGVLAGEVLALVGPNGAGKSTLLGVLAGDAVPERGSVSIGGRPATAWSTVELARRRAVLPQHNPVSFPFDVRAVVEMGRAPWEGTAAEDDDERAVAAALADTELTAFTHRSYPTLSGGEQARTALARVLAQSTGLLLLDEPTAAMDLRHQEQVLTLARARAEAGAGVLVVLHDLGLAAAHADRIAVLSDGGLAALGPPGEVCEAGLLSRVYQHPVEVISHPRTGKPLVLPYREGTGNRP
ncbi:heme ABC transporter ATP-binding protein [Prauserella cavernicola]|uniref:Heme ABC transporter ATP-binding protein n=1 Tax=Prauserella cavernicola TaxID=2800127 RepID=A0A934QVE1_9PSEU|nr:heme ABC transporter ATP-binding protein [Prauserella cavernicola]MBK1786319.1 heme ABC transporter ATP-binding protein [Prauserella cavernicola]